MFLENMQTTCGLLILLHGVISLPDAISYDTYVLPNQKMHLSSQKFL